MISALVMRETDPAQAPLRRGTGAVFTGIMVTVVVAAVFGIIGLVTKVGSDRWRADGAVVVEKETGAVFVFTDGRLTPMLNYTSALLLSGHAPPTVFTVSRKALADTPRDTARGIPGAPDALPGRRGLTGPIWTLCSQPGEDPSGQATATTSLVVGDAAAGGRSLGDSALLTEDPAADTVWLVWRGHRYRVGEPAIVVPSLFGAQAGTVEVGAAWLNGLPEGLEIAPIDVAGRGRVSSALPGWRIGDLIFDQVGTGEQHFLVLDDGLAPITSVQMHIYVGQYSVTAMEAPPAVVNRAPKSSLLPADTPTGVLPPADTPELAGDVRSGAVCAESSGTGAAPEVRLGAVPQADGVPTNSTTADGAVLADRVVVPAGRVALVRSVPAATTLGGPPSTDGGYLIVTDGGMRFAVPSTQVLGTLGFGPADALEVPTSLVNRIPAGPTLDPAAAAAPASAAVEPP